MTTNGNLDGQREHWQVTFQANPNMYGTDPSKAGAYAAELFKQQHIREVVELGSGQGRPRHTPILARPCVIQPKCGCRRGSTDLAVAGG